MLRVTVLELPATWGDPGLALRGVASALAEGPPTDLVLLPEASLTGYVSPAGDFDLTRFAEPLDGPTATSIAAIARRHGVVVVAPLVLQAGDGACFNVMLACGREGEVLFVYRKRHPWFPETWATPGAAPPPVVVIDGARVTIAVCFDIHFLEEEAGEILDTSDLLLFPSAWVDPDDTRGAMLPALATRHHVAIANANWGPGVVRIAGQGGSSIVSARGAVLARTDDVAVGAVELGSTRLARADATLELGPGAG